jgi:signal transduction histidine kinase
MTSGGTAFGFELSVYRTDTDRARRGFDAATLQTGGSGTVSSSITEVLVVISVAERQLATRRREISALTGDVSTHLAFYTRTNDSLLALIGATAAMAPSPGIARTIGAQLALLTATEKLGLLRAQMAAVYVRGGFTAGQRELVAGLLGAYDAELVTFRTLADRASVAAADAATATAPARTTRANIEQALSARSSTAAGLAVTPAAWFDNATTSINALHGVGLANATRIRADTAAIVSRIRWSLALQGLMLVALGVLLWWQVVRVGRRLDQADSDLRRATRELTALNAELDAFSYSVAHDLRAPLRTIDGFARLIEEDEGSGITTEALKHLQRVRAGASRLSELIDALLTLARTGSRAPVTVSVNPVTHVRQVWEELMAQNPNRRVSLAVGDLPACQADPALLDVVLTNLLANAVKFTRHSDDPRVEVTARVVEGWVEFSVSDNGVGFDPAHAERLFGTFQRLHSATDFEGTGIGLALTQRIVHRHGGQISAESTPGQGAAFRFTMPGSALSSISRRPIVPGPRQASDQGLHTRR